jgi:hypothetical protein
MVARSSPRIHHLGGSCRVQGRPRGLQSLAQEALDPRSDGQAPSQQARLLLGTLLHHCRGPPYRHADQGSWRFGCFELRRLHQPGSRGLQPRRYRSAVGHLRCLNSIVVSPHLRTRICTLLYPTLPSSFAPILRFLTPRTLPSPTPPFDTSFP